MNQPDKEPATGSDRAARMPSERLIGAIEDALEVAEDEQDTLVIAMLSEALDAAMRT